MVIVVIDGLGGGIGTQIVTQIRKELPLDVEIIALGTNAIATDKMMRARANRGASGENAIRVSINLADFILAPIGVVIPNSMLGEVTPAIAAAVAGARGRKLPSGRRSPNRSAPPSKSSGRRWRAKRLDIPWSS